MISIAANGNQAIQAVFSQMYTQITQAFQRQLASGVTNSSTFTSSVNQAVDSQFYFRLSQLAG